MIEDNKIIVFGLFHCARGLHSIRLTLRDREPDRQTLTMRRSEIEPHGAFWAGSSLRFANRLFGSHVWGNPHSDSDLDLLIIVPKSDFSPTKRASIAYRCLRDIPYPLDILVKTRKEIERFVQVPVSLEHQIISRGKRLYG